jgi:hypothetical protein
MNIHTIRRMLLGLLLLTSLTLLVWGAWPGSEQAEQHSLTRTEMQLSTPSAQPGAQPPAVLEERRLTLEWPSTLRQAEENRYVQLTLAVAEHGEITPTLSVEGDETSDEPVLIPNVYDTHNVMAEARLDIAGLAVAPDGLTSLSLRPGEAVTFRWNLRATEIGAYRGTVWLYLRYLPLDGSPETRDALKALDIDIHVVNFLGIGGPAARLMGVAGMIACGLFGINDLISGVRWLRRWMRRKQKHAAN